METVPPFEPGIVNLATLSGLEARLAWLSALDPNWAGNPVMQWKNCNPDRGGLRRQPDPSYGAPGG